VSFDVKKIYWAFIIRFKEEAKAMAYTKETILPVFSEYKISTFRIERYHKIQDSFKVEIEYTDHQFELANVFRLLSLMSINKTQTMSSFNKDNHQFSIIANKEDIRSAQEIIWLNIEI
jgi:hypothetical protein